MGIVKGDRIVVSQMLTKPIPELGNKPVSKLAYLSYAFFVARVRDDFGRFAYNARTATTKLAEHRSDINEKEVGKLLEEYRAAGLLRVWTADGREWAEWAKAVRTGNRYHGSPEPPRRLPAGQEEDFAPHVHNLSCIRTAIHQARSCGDKAEAERLSRQLRGLEPLDSAQQLELRMVEDRQPSSASSSSSSNNGLSPPPPLAREGGAASGSPGIKAAVNRIATRARALGRPLDKWGRRRLRTLLEEGVSESSFYAELEGEAERGPPQLRRA